MRRIIGLATGLLLSLSLLVAANAASNAASAPSKSPAGLQNSKKAMQAKAARDKKVRETGKKGQAKRQQAMNDK